MRLVTWHHRGHGASTALTDPALLSSDLYASDVAAVVAATGARVVGGISLGAHAAARFAAGLRSDGPPDLDGLLVAAPGWLGAPDLVAAANALQADELAASGLDATLARVHAGAPPWLAELLQSWWTSHDLASFVTVLRTLAVSDGPGAERLSRIITPCGVAGLHGDPLHPAPVAQAWAAAIPGAVLHELTLDAVGADPAALGHAAVAAWQESAALAGPRVPFT
jgi:hypothetical protein